MNDKREWMDNELRCNRANVSAIQIRMLHVV